MMLKAGVNANVWCPVAGRRSVAATMLSVQAVAQRVEARMSPIRTERRRAGAQGRADRRADNTRDMRLFSFAMGLLLRLLVVE